MITFLGGKLSIQYMIGRNCTQAASEKRGEKVPTRTKKEGIGHANFSGAKPQMQVTIIFLMYKQVQGGIIDHIVRRNAPGWHMPKSARADGSGGGEDDLG